MTKKIMSRFFLASLFVLVVSSCVCTDSRKKVEQKEQEGSDKDVALLSSEELSASKQETLKAVAVVKGIGDAKVSGTVTFTKVPEGVKIVADINGLTPGKHGFHVHEHGDCSGSDGMKAGGHFNPTHTKHGGPDSLERHVGDFGNLDADAKGHAYYERVDTLIAFEGTNSILGRSIMIHADPDDYVTQPTGASGARIGCGLITPQ